MFTGSSERQTQSFLARRFAETGIRPRTALGQNFLIDMNLQRLLLETAELGPHDVVLEVGTGTGSLTAMMAPLVAAVVTVELDPRLFQLAGEELIHFDNVVMLQLDALKSKNRLSPVLLETLAAQRQAAPGRRLKLLANLPYSVATPILANLLAIDDPPQTMTVTIQKELAERITARPGTKDYGALSVWVQSQCRAEIVRVLPPSVFWPRPKVFSTFIHIALDEALRRRIPDREFFHDFVRAMFFHRRKFVRSELRSACQNRLDKRDVDRVLGEQGIDPSCRAEELGVDALLDLCEAVRQEFLAVGPPCRGGP